MNIMCISEAFFNALQKKMLNQIIWLNWCQEQVCEMIEHKQGTDILNFQKSSIEEIKDLQKNGVKNAVSGDAKYDSPGTGKVSSKLNTFRHLFRKSKLTDFLQF